MYMQKASHSKACRTWLASYPAPAQLSVATSPYYKRWKAGRGLGTRLELGHCLQLGQTVQCITLLERYEKCNEQLIIISNVINHTK